MRPFLFFLVTLFSLFLSFTGHAQTQGLQVRGFLTMTQLLTSNPNNANRMVWLAGQNDVSDGQGGTFLWDPASTAVADNENVFEVPGFPVGRWLRVNFGGNVVTPPGVTNYTFIVAPTISDLKATAVTNGIQGVYVQGYSTPGDGGAGTFTYNETSTDPEDGGMRIAPNNGAGMWHREVPSPLVGYPVRWWGATPTNGTIQAPIDFASGRGGGRVIIPTGSWEVKGDDATRIVIKSNVTLEGEAGAELVIGATVAPTNSYSIITCNEGTTNISIAVLSLRGYRAAAPGAPTNYGRGIHLTCSTNVTIDRVLFSDHWENAIELSDSGVNVNEDVEVLDCEYRNNQGVGLNPNGAVKTHTSVRPQVSILEFGADPTGNTSSSNAFASALKAVNPNGGTIIIPPGRYALNNVVTNRNIRITGFARFTGLQGGVTSTNALVPWDINLPVLQVGNGSNYVMGFYMEHCNFSGSGPNGVGKFGFVVGGGATGGRYFNNSFQSFDYASLIVWPTNSPPLPANHHYFEGGVIQGAGPNYYAGFLLKDGGAGADASGVQFDNTVFNGTTVGHVIVADGRGFVMNGCSVQLGDTPRTGILLTNSARLFFGNHTGIDMAIVGATPTIQIESDFPSRISGNYFGGNQGSYALNSLIRLERWDGQIIQIPSSSQIGVDGAYPFMLQPEVHAYLTFIDGSEASGNTNKIYDKRIYASSSNFYVENTNGTLRLGAKNGVFITNSLDVLSTVSLHGSLSLDEVKELVFLDYFGSPITNLSVTVDSLTDIITSVGHGLVANQRIRFITGTPPGGIFGGVRYFVRDITNDTFRISDTAGGAVYDMTTDGAAVTIDVASVTQLGAGAIGTDVSDSFYIQSDVGPIRLLPNTYFDIRHTNNPLIRLTATAGSFPTSVAELGNANGKTYLFPSSAGASNAPGTFYITSQNFATNHFTVHSTNGLVEIWKALAVVGGSGSVLVLTNDNQVIDTSNGYILVTSDNVTAANRTMVLAPGIQRGQQLIITWLDSAANLGELLDNSALSFGAGGARINGNWSPDNFDSITLDWTSVDWVERCRSAN